MDFLKRVIAERASGQRPSPFVAGAAAGVAGVGAAVMVYKALRSG